MRFHTTIRPRRLPGMETPMAELSRELAVKLGYRLTLAVVLAAFAVLAVDALGRGGGVTAILVFSVGCTVRLIAGGAARFAHRRVRSYGPDVAARAAAPDRVPPSAARNG
jgi:hypothetical protein